jgi:diguanylate cyclase (GGDEF)-like protein/PAS domain S-box-containing protein
MERQGANTKTQEREARIEEFLIAPEPEPAFDDLASMAAWMCGATAGVIAIRDKGEPWLKAAVGLPSNATELTRELCARALGSQKTLVLSDLEGYPGAGADPPLRFFAGMPLVLPYGNRVGVLAVADVMPRKLDAAQEQRLAAVGKQILTQMELRRILAELASTIGERHDLELALRASEERYRELFENANDVVYTHDLTEHFTSINAAGERITGYARDEVLGMNFAQVIAPEYLELARQMMARKLAGEPPRVYELDIIAKGGQRISLELSTRLLRQDGVPVGIQGIARDITERRQAQAELRDANDKLQMQVAELEQHSRETNTMNEMGDMLQLCTSAREAYVVIARAARELFLHYSGSLLILDAGRNVVESAARWGDHLQGDDSFPPEECWAMRRGRSHRVESETVGPLCRHAGPNFRGSTLCVPMMAQGEALGVLHLQGAGGEFPAGLRVPMTAAVERLAISLAEHIALSLANLRLRATLHNQSIRDPLTGLFNRRYLEESITRELQRAGRKQRPVGIIMMDVDHFKKFNDTFGHQAGDGLLREIGTFLLKHTRGDDIACRYGGEEFTVILPEAPLEVARQRAERMRQAVKGLFPQGDPARSITLSFGVAAFPQHGAIPMDLLRAADRALYQAKSAGRDCIVVAEGHPGASQGSAGTMS